MNDLDVQWERCVGFFGDALSYSNGTHTIEDIKEAVACGKMQFWPGVNSVIVTELIQFPRKKACNVFAAGGSLKEILIMRAFIEAWAKDNRCDFIQCSGRKGWDRVLKDSDHRYITICKEL